MILISIGVFLLLRIQFDFDLQNWWALFIMLPALGGLGGAWTLYQEAGRITAPVRGALFGWLMLCLISAMFLFNLNWTLLGPMILVLAGAGLLINGLLPE